MLKQQAKKKRITPSQRALEKLTKQVATMKTSMQELKRENVDHRMKVEKSIRDAKNSREEVRKLYTLMDAKTVDKAKKDASVISYHYSIAFTKTLVISEVITAYSQRKTVSIHDVYKMYVLTTKAFDNTNEWWAARRDYTILQWINALLNDTQEKVKLRTRTLKC